MTPRPPYSYRQRQPRAMRPAAGLLLAALSRTALSLLVLSLLVLSLTGCATPYGPMGPTGGIAALPLSQQRYEITVDSNAFTPLDRAQDLALLKAAELTLAAGRERFVVEQSAMQAEQDKAIGNFLGLTAAWPPFLAPPHRGRGSLTVRLLSPTDDAFADGLLARQLYAQLAPRYKNAARL